MKKFKIIAIAIGIIFSIIILMLFIKPEILPVSINTSGVCHTEGHEIFYGGSDNIKCCGGLVKKPVSNPPTKSGKEMGFGCVKSMCSCYVCLRCGDGLCEGEENECNCPEDCK